MKKYSNKRKTNKKSKKMLATILLVVLLAILAIVTYRDRHSPKIVANPGDHIAQPNPSNSPSPNGSSTNSAPKSSTNGNNLVSGGGQDTKGQSTTPTNQSQWTVSSSGNITVYQPISNATLSSGAVLSGAAKVSQVSFRLLDNSVGKISEGILSVVNGKYSGKMFFTSHSSGGQLDVYSVDANGKELNEVQITVRF